MVVSKLMRILSLVKPLSRLMRQKGVTPQSLDGLVEGLLPILLGSEYSMVVDLSTERLIDLTKDATLLGLKYSEETDYLDYNNQITSIGVDDRTVALLDYLQKRTGIKRSSLIRVILLSIS